MLQGAGILRVGDRIPVGKKYSIHCSILLAKIQDARADDFSNLDLSRDTVTDVVRERKCVFH